VTKDAKIIDSYEKRNFFESQLYALKDKVNNLANNEDTKVYCTTAIFDQYSQYFSQIEDQLDDIGNYEATLKQAQSKVQELTNSIDQLKKEHSEVNE
jgi:chromosome segregation ATPase